MNFNDKLLISLVGLDYSRKHFFAEQIKKRFNINIIYVDRLIESKIKDWNDFKQKGIEISKVT